ncbi:hypothetical protein DdX_19922 [Ditylenchus destructor]|uniref:Uncharacterized protein n=1 Tax=Ditylenchus destructor TaxID=166010 RepID=A0AAD4MI61_9BILA|nr:hypothetical protein DdX_19922 [Ditylenchus destructor]
MTEPLKFFIVDDKTIYHNGFSFSFHRNLDPPKSSADLQLHQSFHCALRSAQEQNCRSRCHVTGNWQTDKKGRRFMLGIVKKGDHTHGPDYRDTVPKFKFYKNNDGSLNRNGFDYSLYRELDPPKQTADFQWYEAYRCSMSDQENCRARIYTRGYWEVNDRQLRYQLGIYKNCIHSHGSDQVSDDEICDEQTVTTAPSSTRTKDLDKKEQIRFYKFKLEKRVEHGGFIYSEHRHEGRKLYPVRMRCLTQIDQNLHPGRYRICNSFIRTTGEWKKDGHGREYQIGIVMAPHLHDPYQISIQGKDNDDEPDKAGSKFYQYKGTRVYRDGYVYCVDQAVTEDPNFKVRMHCSQATVAFPCKGAIWTTGEWETDSRGRVYQRGILRNGHSHKAYEQFLNEDDATHVGEPMDDKRSLDEDDVVMVDEDRMDE